MCARFRCCCNDPHIRCALVCSTVTTTPGTTANYTTGGAPLTKSELIQQAQQHDAKANQDWARGDYGSAVVEEAKDLGDRFRAAFAPTTQTYGVPPPAAERVGEADTLPGSTVQPSSTGTGAVYSSQQPYTTTTTETTRRAVP